MKDVLVKLEILLSNNIQNNSIYDTLDLLTFFKKPPVNGNVLIGENVITEAVRPISSFYKDLPDLPDIESTELFDPVYLEDIEIENEENLSLTIHSNDTELISVHKKVSRLDNIKGLVQIKVFVVLFCLIL